MENPAVQFVTDKSILDETQKSGNNNHQQDELPNNTQNMQDFMNNLNDINAIYQEVE